MEPAKSPASVLRALMGDIMTRNRGRPELARVGGNFHVWIEGEANWTVVTQGARTGIYDGECEDEIAFALICDRNVLEVLLTRSEESADLITAHLRDGTVAMKGDLEIYERFMALPDKDNLISLRANLGAKRK